MPTALRSHWHGTNKAGGPLACQSKISVGHSTPTVWRAPPVFSFVGRARIYVQGLFHHNPQRSSNTHVDERHPESKDAGESNRKSQLQLSKFQKLGQLWMTFNNASPKKHGYQIHVSTLNLQRLKQQQKKPIRIRVQI